MKVAVIGASNIDIYAQADSAFLPKDSNPGHVHVAFGGVGRNISHNLCLLHQDVYFFTSFGGDAYGDALKKDCKFLGMHLEYARQMDGQKSSYYICINDEQGEMEAAVSDMELVHSIDVSYLQQNLPVIQSMQATVFDANLDQEAMEYLLQKVSTPLFVDVVSSKKAKKMADALCSVNQIASPCLSLKANCLEASEMTGIDIEQKSGLKQAANWFHEKGIARVFITRGSRDVYLSDRGAEAFVPCEKVPVINSSGAGDAFLAGIVFAESMHMDTIAAARTGIRASSLTLQCSAAVNGQMSPSKLL